MLDVTANQILAAKEIDAPLEPASLTKLMTIYLTFSALDSGRLALGDSLPVSASALNAPPTKMGLPPGERVPLLVLHGEADPLVPVEGGHDTAASIPGARIRTIPGWGHDLPLDLVDTLAEEIAGHARVAD